jgi:hypothetical protein
VATEPRLKPLGHWVQQFVSDRLSNIVHRMVGVILLMFDVYVQKGEKVMMQETDFRRDKSKSSFIFLRRI